MTEKDEQIGKFRFGAIDASRAIRTGLVGGAVGIAQSPEAAAAGVLIGVGTNVIARPIIRALAEKHFKKKFR